MLSFFELFSNLLEFLINQLNWTISWLSPFRIRIQDRSDQDLTSISPTAEGDHAQSADSLLNVEIDLSGTGEFMPFHFAFYTSLNDSVNLLAQPENTNWDTVHQPIAEATSLELALAVGEPLGAGSQSNLSSDGSSDRLFDQSSEQSPYWYELIADLENDVSYLDRDLFFPLRNLLNGMERSNSQQPAESDAAELYSFSSDRTNGEIQTSTLEWTDTIAVIDSPDLSSPDLSSLDLSSSDLTSPDLSNLDLASQTRETSFKIANAADILSTEYGVSIGAMEEDGVIADFSQSRSLFADPLLASRFAPNADLLSSTPDYSYGYFSGSETTAHISGVAMRMSSVNPALTASSLEFIFIGMPASAETMT